jgi:hypothetical protein
LIVCISPFSPSHIFDNIINPAYKSNLLCSNRYIQKAVFRITCLSAINTICAVPLPSEPHSQTLIKPFALSECARRCEPQNTRTAATISFTKQSAPKESTSNSCHDQSWILSRINKSYLLCAYGSSILHHVHRRGHWTLCFENVHKSKRHMHSCHSSEHIVVGLSLIDRHVCLAAKLKP